MNASPTPLFRREVLERREKRLYGDVSVAVPISWQLVGYFLFAALAAALIFLFSASYSRIETVPGMIVGPRGAMADHAAPRVELYVAPGAVRFFTLGQETQLAVEAFPYQRFGTVGARITQISPMAAPKATAGGTMVPTYIVTADLDTPWISAAGRRLPLLSGMRLSARIVTQKQSLFGWLFDPLAAINTR